MIRCFLAIALLAIGATFSHAQPSLPSSFQAKTVHSPEAADIFVRWGGKGPVVVLIHGYAENSDSWAPLAADSLRATAGLGVGLVVFALWPRICLDLGSKASVRNKFRPEPISG
jgi:hypothetical protein